MSTVTIGVSDIELVKQRTAAAFRGEEQGEHISFATVELLWKTLTPRRWELLRTLSGRGPMTLPAIARLVDRDTKTTFGDVQALLQAGILEKGETGEIRFPYDAVLVDFTISKVA